VPIKRTAGKKKGRKEEGQIEKIKRTGKVKQQVLGQGDRGGRERPGGRESFKKDRSEGHLGEKGEDPGGKRGGERILH